MANTVTDWNIGERSVTFDLDTAAEIETKELPTQIHSDFTLVINVSGADTSSETVTWKILISYDGGDTHITAASASGATYHNIPLKYVYDYDNLGPVPNLKLALTPSGTSSGEIKCQIFEHAGRRRF